MSELLPIPAWPGLRIELAYATRDNLAGRAVYAPGARAALRAPALQALQRALQCAQQAGLGMILYDAWRPAAAQQVFWQALPDPRYIADASKGSNHTRGVALDVSLLDADGVLLDMGTGFDAMCDQSHHDRQDLPARVQRNRLLLLGVMRHAGFCSIPTEWWHYELPDARQYPLLDQDPMITVLP